MKSTLISYDQINAIGKRMLYLYGMNLMRASAERYPLYVVAIVCLLFYSPIVSATQCKGRWLQYSANLVMQGPDGFYPNGFHYCYGKWDSDVRNKGEEWGRFDSEGRAEVRVILCKENYPRPPDKIVARCVIKDAFDQNPVDATIALEPAGGRGSSQLIGVPYSGQPSRAHDEEHGERRQKRPSHSESYQQQRHFVPPSNHQGKVFTVTFNDGSQECRYMAGNFSPRLLLGSRSGDRVIVGIGPDDGICR